MNTLQAAHKLQVHPLAAVRMRTRFLLESVAIFEKMKDQELAAKWIEDAYNEIIDLHLKIQRKPENKIDGITDQDIIQARDYPIESLIDFHKGKALAWCHDDKRPSLAKRKNRAVCYPCGNSFDPIAVLMSRDGLSFIDAVRRLI